MKWKHLVTTAVTLSLFVATQVVHSAPASPIKGTIPVQDDSSAASLSKAKIDITQALQAVSKLQPGKIVKAELEEENGFLVWEIEVITEAGSIAELLLDAGDGSVLRRTPETK